MNTVGNLGGFVATLLTGKILGWFKDSYAHAHGLHLTRPGGLDGGGEGGSGTCGGFEGGSREVLKVALLPGYNINFLIYAVIYVMAVLLWLGIDATKPVLPEDAAVSGGGRRGTGVPAERLIIIG